MVSIPVDQGSEAEGKRLGSSTNHRSGIVFSDGHITHPTFWLVSASSIHHRAASTMSIRVMTRIIFWLAELASQTSVFNRRVRGRQPFPAKSFAMEKALFADLTKSLFSIPLRVNRISHIEEPPSSKFVSTFPNYWILMAIWTRLVRALKNPSPEQ